MINEINWEIDHGSTPFDAFSGSCCVRSLDELVKAIEKQIRKNKFNWCRSVSYQDNIFYIWSTSLIDKVQKFKIALVKTDICCTFVIEFDFYPPDFWYSLQSEIRKMLDEMIITDICSL